MGEIPVVGGGFWGVEVQGVERSRFVVLFCFVKGKRCLL